MSNNWKRACAIGLVSVLVVAMLMSIPAVVAKGPKPPPLPPPPADPAIAFLTGSFDKIMVMNADGSNQAAIYENEGMQVMHPSWSPDGGSIAFGLQGYQYAGLWRIDVEVIDGVPQGHNLQELATWTWGPQGDVFLLGSIGWSPLGNEIAYLYHTVSDNVDTYGVDAVPATGGTPYSIYTPPVEYGLPIGCGVAWSTDGTQLAISRSGHIKIIDRATGLVTKELLRGQYTGICSVDWARQGVDELVFNDNTDMIYTVDIDTEAVAPVVQGILPSWSPDNSKIVFLKLGKRPQLHITCTYDFNTGEITQLVKGANGYFDWRRF